MEKVGAPAAAMFAAGLFAEFWAEQDSEDGPAIKGSPNDLLLFRKQNRHPLPFEFQRTLNLSNVLDSLEHLLADGLGEFGVGEFAAAK